MISSLAIAAGTATAQCQDHEHPCAAGANHRASPVCLTEAIPDLSNPKEIGWGVRTLPAVGPGFVVDPSTCFAPGTVLTGELVARYNQIRGLGGVGFDQRYVTGGYGWGIANRGATMTWSLVPDGTSLHDGYSSALFSNMDLKFGGNRDLWTGYIQSSFDEISRVCAARFRRVNDDGAPWPNSPGSGTVRGDIRLCSGYIDGRNTVLAYAYPPGYGDIRLDLNEQWDLTANAYRFFRNVFVHELCHSLGVNHSCPQNQTKLMEAFLSLSFDIIQHDDILALQKLYGDALEPNGNRYLATTATSEANTTIEFHTYSPAANSATASLVPGDQDWMKSSLPASMPVTLTAAPVGMSYDASATQIASETCNSGNFVNSRTQVGLRVEIRDADGNLIAGAQGAPGQTVTVSAQVPQGNYYSVVKPATSANFDMPQMYTLTRTIGAPQAPLNNPWFEGILLGQMPYGMTIAGTSFGATTDGSASFQPGGVLGTQDVYYNFAPWDGAGRFRITASGNHLVSVHRATGVPTPLNQWTPLNQNQNNGLGGVLEVNITDLGPCIIRVAVPAGGTPGPHTVSVRYMDGPSNDSCQTPIDISTGTYNGTTIYARPEPTPYPASCTTDTFTLPWGAWYRFTAPSEGTLSLDVCNTFLNTIIGVYAGCPESGGALIACNDNTPSCPNGGSALTIPVVTGQQYLIRVSHFQNLTGNFQLNAVFNRHGDTCEDASPVSVGDNPFSNLDYTTDSSSCNSGATRWYRYTATGYSTVTANTCEDTTFDTTLAAWNACPSGGGTLITCNDDACNLQSSISFQSFPGQQFLLAVGGYNGAMGTGTLRINETPIPGEVCSSPIVVTEGSIPFSTVGHATDGPAEPNCNFCCDDPQIHGDLWYVYVATQTGTLTASTCDANYDSKMAAYEHCPSTDGTAIACADDDCGLQARMSFPVIEGENYYIRVGGFGGWTGSGNLVLSLTPACPADFNGDRFLDGFDYDDFVACFEGDTCPPGKDADFNHDGFPDGFDYDDFVAAFETGC